MTTSPRCTLVVGSCSCLAGNCWKNRYPPHPAGTRTARPTKRMIAYFMKNHLRAGSAARLQLLLGSLGSFGRVLERYHLAFLESPGHDNVFVVALAHLDVACLEALSHLY